MCTREVILRLVFPIQNLRSLIPDQNLIVSSETVIVVTGPEKTVIAKHFRVIEQLCLRLLPFCGGAE